MSAIDAIFRGVGEATRSFECCDTHFELHVEGIRAERALEEAERAARYLESQLNAFDEESDVAVLNGTGSVRNEHVARIVERALEYEDATDGVFSVRHGGTERAIKRYIEAGGPRPEPDGDRAEICVDGDVVRATAPLDLNGIAKGYLVDQTHEALVGPGRRGFVNGGGDIAGPTGGGVAIENPYGEEPLTVLGTDWSIATSGEYKRRRSGVDHIYRPAEGAVGALNSTVTVVAERDCTEADVLATTCAALHPDDAIDLIDGWDGAEAFLVHEGVFHSSEGFDAHVA